jgi:transcriptional regulator
MYIPKHFREDDLAVLHAFMQEHSFATLITQQDGIPLANHFPFLLDTERGPNGTLMAHMARANAQWRTFHDAKEVLVIFQGPHTYISPSWYEDEVESSVPTWNYSVVHAYGIPRLIEDNTELYNLVQTLTQANEAHFENPWVLQPQEYVQKKLQAIVGFEVQITRLEGKFKRSQNRSQRDQARVIAALQDAEGDR